MDAPAFLKPEDLPGFSHDDPTVNRVELVGYLGQDPEQRYLPSGQPLARFSIATHRLHTRADGQMEERTDWHHIVADEALAPVYNRLGRGDLVRIIGYLRTRSWETARGERHWRTEVIASEIHPVRTRWAAKQWLLPLGESFA